MTIKNLLALATLICTSGMALAEDVAVPAATEAQPQTATVNVPARGITMSKVETTFGAPTQREAAIGKPPITRWEYPNFVVYFEHEHVIHSVLR
jgi:hypothetical protein